MSQITEDHSSTIKSLVTKTDIERVYRRFEEFASYKHLESFKKEVQPLVTKCNKDNEKFCFEHQQMREMIRRFDECISEKANKMSLMELEQKIGENFLHKKMWQELQEKFTDLNTKISVALASS